MLSDYPVVNAFQGTKGGLSTSPNVFVSKFNASGSALVYSTYLASAWGDGEAIAVDSAGDALVTGHTTSGLSLQNPVQAVNAGGAFGLLPVGDAFVSVLNPSDSALVFSTYLGGSGPDDGLAIAVDAAGNAYVAGWTQSTNFPTQNAFQSTNGGGKDAFFARITLGPAFDLGGPATSTAGNSVSITVSAVDGSGNVNPNYTGTVHFTSSDFLAVLPGDYTFTTADQGCTPSRPLSRNQGSRRLPSQIQPPAQ